MNENKFSSTDTLSFKHFYFGSKVQSMVNIYSITAFIIFIVYIFIVYAVSSTIIKSSSLENKFNQKRPIETVDPNKKQEDLQDVSTVKLNNSSEVKKKDKFRFSAKKRKLFAEECLEAHNKYRKIHNVPLLTLNKKLNKVSQHWADYLAETKTFEHMPNNSYGENLYTFSTSKIITKLTMNGSEPVDAWYTEEIPFFTFGSEDVDYTKTGHFTQLIWASTKYLGVGVAKEFDNNTIYVVCEYDPPGNYEGEYSINVPPIRYAKGKIKKGSGTEFRS